ncbi:hypothetical protein CEXT_292901 [Caerostris extrusa]|uniref:Uncharacterized protein n=1 Tax=Caerostris extrusa TaxID=172846 RepID=A0AAV4Y0U3_CAEEX|nr:hypothetical protein CEXT_292901 [Caerostris extrusa]
MTDSGIWDTRGFKAAMAMEFDEISTVMVYFSKRAPLISESSGYYVVHVRKFEDLSNCSLSGTYGLRVALLCKPLVSTKSTYQVLEIALI